MPPNSNAVRNGQFVPLQKVSDVSEITSHDAVIAHEDNARRRMKLKLAIIAFWLLAIAAAIVFFSLGCTLFSSACY